MPFDGLPQSPFLSRLQEYSLAKRYLSGDLEAGQLLATSHMPLVKKIAKTFRRYGMDVEDLISEGTMGLMEALGRFDPDRGARLSTYAAWWIAASVREYVRKNRPMASLNTPVGEGGTEEIELLADDRDNAEQTLGEREEASYRKDRLRRALEGLSEVERHIVAARHLSVPAMPLRDLGRWLGMTGEGVRKIEAKALKRLARQIRT